MFALHTIFTDALKNDLLIPQFFFTHLTFIYTSNNYILVYIHKASLNLRKEEDTLCVQRPCTENIRTSIIVFVKFIEALLFFSHAGVDLTR